MNFIAQHGKNYADLEEFNLRAELFRKFDADVKFYNATEQHSRHGHNFLSDMTAEEKTRLLGLKNMAQPERQPVTEVQLPGALPATVNWCTAGKCNPIQNQGACGSCWAFSAAAAMESARAIFHGSLVKLSEQNFVSCSSL